jgi:hypothetical protein
VLELAKECSKLEVFTHVSTSYVNCTRRGSILEEIYEPGLEVESIVKSIMAKSVQEVTQNEKQLIGAFPNTYTYTKNLAEKNLINKMGDIKVNILRPAIIASAHREPFPGWTDTLSAAGGMTMLGGHGLLKFVHGAGNTPLDIIPVDIVTNSIILSTCHAALAQQKLHIYNSAASDANPCPLKDYGNYMTNSLKNVQLNNRITDSIKIEFIPNENTFKMKSLVY